MKKNAFTLIELLAVIIILGLLAVLIIPKINQTIEDARKNTYESSAYALVREADNYYLTKKAQGIEFTGCSYDFGTKTNTCTGFEFSGKAPESGTLTISTTGQVAIAVKFDKYCYKKTYATEDLQTLQYNAGTCNY